MFYNSLGQVVRDGGRFYQIDYLSAHSNQVSETTNVDGIDPFADPVLQVVAFDKAFVRPGSDSKPLGHWKPELGDHFTQLRVLTSDAVRIHPTQSVEPTAVCVFSNGTIAWKNEFDLIIDQSESFLQNLIVVPSQCYQTANDLAYVGPQIGQARSYEVEIKEVLPL